MSDLLPICPKCGAIMSEADYHKSNSDYFAVCLDCDEDFYQIEIKEFIERVKK
jgi:transcription elongation factor Elf1